MSAIRYRFEAGDPIPERGVVTPDVFPDPRKEGNEQLNLHDILGGRIPGVRRGQTPRQGWLKIAYGNGKDLDYTTPGTYKVGQKVITAISLNVDVEEAVAIRRVSTALNPDALEPPAFNGRAFRFAEDTDLVKVTPVEQAIAFTGVAEIKDTERVVRGIHFASGEENGWLHIGDPVEPLDPAA